MTMTTPEVQRQAAGERPVINELRQDLLDCGDYDAVADQREALGLFTDQLRRTTDFVASHQTDEKDTSVTPEEAVSVLWDAADPAVTMIIDGQTAEKTSDTDLSHEERKAMREQVAQAFWDSIVERVTPEDEEGSEPDHTVYEDEII